MSTRQRSDVYGNHEHAVEDGRAEICLRTGHCAGARHSFLYCMPITSRIAARYDARVGSAQADPYLATASAVRRFQDAAGGANEEVLRMLDEIGSKNNVPLHQEIKEARAS